MSFKSRHRLLGVGLLALSTGMAALGQGNQAGPAAASQPATQPHVQATTQLLQHVQDRLRTVESVESDFVQEKNLAMFEHTLTIRGHFALKKPNRLIWIVREPVKYAVSLHGDVVRQWDQDTDKVQTINLGADPAFKAVSDQLNAWFLGDYRVLTQIFEVEVLGPKPLRLGFTPKPDATAAKFIKHVEMTFGDDELYVDHIVVLEVGGDVTKLDFVHTQLNKPIAPATWEIPPHE